MKMDWENFNAKKMRMMVQIGAPLVAFLLIMLLVVLPLVFLSAALEREAKAKGREEHKIFNINLF
jgi:hypothetical protein